MSKKRLTLSFLMAATLASGCAMETDVDTDLGVEPSSIGVASQPVQVIGFTRWSQGEDAKPMGSTAERFCFLTAVAGDFDGGGEYVHVYVSNESWYLGGDSRQEGVSAEARCVPLTWNGRHYGFTGARSWSQGNNPTNLGSTSDRTCVLTRVTGKFQGGGERVEVYRSGGSWWLGGASLAEGVAATARCLIDSSTVGPYNWRQDTDPRILAPTSTHACGLSRMTGHFEGGGEYIRVYSASGSWYLGGDSAQEGVAASAYCMF